MNTTTSEAQETTDAAGSGSGASPADPIVRTYPPMTSEERVAVRRQLVAEGFERLGVTPDPGNGAYEERWFSSSHDGRTYITVRWAPKKVEG